MSIILKNIHNKEFQRDVLNKSKTSNFINISEDHSDNSKIKFKDNNHSDINPIKNKIRTKLLYSKFKLEKIPKFKKNKTRNSRNFFKISKYLSIVSNSIKSRDNQNSYSIKTLEKNIQQKIIV